MASQYAALENAIREGDVAAGVDEAVRLAKSGLHPARIFAESIEPCLVEVGDRFGRLEIFLPELMQAADVAKAAQDVLLPYIQAGGTGEEKGRIVLGTASGDLHDIGKNIVRLMLEANGFKVLDLGVDVPADRFIRSAVDYDADIIAISVLMLPSLPYMRDVIDRVKQTAEYRERFKILVGGGPVSAEWARGAGADGYGEDAFAAVQEAARLVNARGSAGPAGKTEGVG